MLVLLTCASIADCECAARFRPCQQVQAQRERNGRSVSPAAPWCPAADVGDYPVELMQDDRARKQESKGSAKTSKRSARRSFVGHEPATALTIGPSPVPRGTIRHRHKAEPSKIRRSRPQSCGLHVGSGQQRKMSMNVEACPRHLEISLCIDAPKTLLAEGT
jgi:hypothetical protein